MLLNLEDVVLSTMFTQQSGKPVKFLWRGQGRQRTLLCVVGEVGLAARVPAEHPTYDDEGKMVGTAPTTREEEVDAARRLVAQVRR